MTDTGRFPGERQPENAGGQPDGGQPGYPVHGSHPYGPSDGLAPEAAATGPASGMAVDADVLLPGSQGAWTEGMPADAAHAAHAAPAYQQPQATGKYDVYGQQAAYAPQEFHDPYAAAQADPYAQQQAAAVEQTPGPGEQFAGQQALQQTQQAQQAQPFEHYEHAAQYEQVHQVQQAQEYPQHDAATAAAAHEPGPHETDGRDSGAIDVGAVRNGRPEAPTPAQGTPRPQTPPRRPLHLGPPEPEQSGAVRPLSDRGLNRPGGKRKRKAASAQGPDAGARTQGRGEARGQGYAPEQAQPPVPGREQAQAQGHVQGQGQPQPPAQDPAQGQGQDQGQVQGHGQAHGQTGEQIPHEAQPQQEPAQAQQQPQPHAAQPQGEAPAAQGDFATAGTSAYAVGPAAGTAVPEESPETLPGPQLGALPPHDASWAAQGTPAEGVPAAPEEAPTAAPDAGAIALAGPQLAAPAPENVQPQPVPQADATATAVPEEGQVPQEAVPVPAEAVPAAEAPPQEALPQEAAPQARQQGPDEASAAVPADTPADVPTDVPADVPAPQETGDAAPAAQPSTEQTETQPQPQPAEAVPAVEVSGDPATEQPQPAHAGAPEPEASAVAAPEEQPAVPKPGSGRRRRRRAKEPNAGETSGTGNTWVSAPGSTAVEAIEPRPRPDAAHSAGVEGAGPETAAGDASGSATTEAPPAAAPEGEGLASTVPAQPTHRDRRTTPEQQADRARQDTPASDVAQPQAQQQNHQQPQPGVVSAAIPAQQPRSAEASAVQDGPAPAADATGAAPVAVRVAETETEAEAKAEADPAQPEAAADSDSAPAPAPGPETASASGAGPEAVQPEAAVTVPRQGGKHGRRVEDAPAPADEAPSEAPAADTPAPAEPTVEGAAVSVPADQPSEEAATAVASPGAPETEAAPVPQQTGEPQPQPEPSVAPDTGAAESAAAPESAASPEPEATGPAAPEQSAPGEAEPADARETADADGPADASRPGPAAADTDLDAATEAEAEAEAEADAKPEADAEPAPAEGQASPAEEQAPSVGPAAPGYADAEREAVHRLMRERRDIRNGFRSDPIPHDVLLRVLEAAHTAPSVGHSQPWDFVVIRSEDTRRAMHELAEKQRHAYAESLPKARKKQFKELKIEAILDTPVNIVVTADPTRGGRHTLGRHTQPQMAPYSSALAVENLWLAARAEGLGVGWVSFFDEREMVRALELPEHLEVVAYLCVGYVDEFPPEPELAQAGWSKRRPLSWVVHEESYGRRVLPGAEPQDLLSDTVAAIRPLDAKALGEAWERQKRMTKPSGALGMLEIISAQLCGLSRKCPPPIPEPAAVAIFAGDHGVHAQGVTPWPQEVTGQMVGNFLGGGAVCNAFANQVGAEVCVIDVGVAGELPSTPGLLPRKIRAGTDDMTQGPAMTRDEALRAVEVGIETARDLVAAGNKAVLTGEMGIANTTASAVLIAACTGADPSEVTGRGTGINDETHARKVDVVRRVLELHQPDTEDPLGMLAAVGGLEHAALVGLILGGASLRTPVILDGVSAGAAALVARCVAPEALAACIAGHRSSEPGHVAALTKLGLRPLVDLDLRLGEGTGALLSLPLVQSAARAMHEVATFDSAGVTGKS